MTYESCVPVYTHEKVDDGHGGSRLAYEYAGMVFKDCDGHRYIDTHSIAPIVKTDKRTYCGHCGRQLSNHASRESFCPKCGWRIIK